AAAANVGTGGPAAGRLGFIRESVTSLPPYHFRHDPRPIKLDQNEAPDDLSRELRADVLERLEKSRYNRYPDLHPVELEAAVAQRHQWPADGVVVANGSNVLIQALVILAGVGRAVATVRPSFAVYSDQARLLGSDLHQVPLG